MKKYTFSLMLLWLLLPATHLQSQITQHKLPQNYVCLSGEVQSQELDFTGGTRSLLAEDFSAGCPPAGWSITGDGQENWQSSASNNAGGTPPEAMFSWSPNFTGNSKLTSPEINTTGTEVLVLDFSQMVDDYSGDYTLKVETTPNGNTWNEVWSENVSGSSGPETKSLLIDNDDVGSAGFQFAFTFEGDSYNINQWYLDDVVLSEGLDKDAGVTVLNVPPLVSVDELVTLTAMVKNFGITVANFDVLLEIKQDGTTVFSDTQNITDLAALEDQMVTFDSWTSQIGTYEVTVTTQLAGDENSDNDMMNAPMQVITNVVAKKPLFEEFTSSTCAPCASANPIIDQVLGSNPGEYSLIKYQMDWPGAGDPYYTEQGGVRRDYYAISAVPSLFGNAQIVDPAASMSQEIFDAVADDVTGLSIEIDATIDDDFVISVDAGINAFADYPAGLRAFIVVVEKTTYGNVSTNGEGSFNHVMMAMLPDAQGTELAAMTSGTQVPLSESFDMSQTFMEQPNDLAAVVFVQNPADKSILQSEMVDVTGDFTTWSVTFNVEDSDGNAVEDAIVDFGINGPQTTNASGQAVFATVFPGTFEYGVSKSGLLPATGTVEVVDQNIAVDVVLDVPDFYFFEDFDSGLPGDWTKYISSGNSNNLYWYDGFVVFWMQSAGDEDIMLITPEINLTQAGTLFFEAGDIYSTPGISVGTVDDPQNPDSYEELANFTLAGPMTEYSVVLQDMNVTDSYLAFKYDGPPQGYFYFDNVKISVSTNALPVPTELDATVDGQDVTLNWTAPEYDGLLGYNIFRDQEEIAFTGETGYLDAGLEDGLYTYYVTAVYDEGESGASNTATANVGNVLVYCDAQGGCDQYFSSVVFAGIDNSSSCTEYGDYTDLTAHVDPGETYTLSLVVSSASTGDDIGIWIDFNQDGVFDEEENLVCEMNNSQGAFDFDIPIPSDALPGVTRMRLRVKYWGDVCQPCGSSTWGETEDYSVEISDPTATGVLQEQTPMIWPNPANRQVRIRSGANIQQYWLYDYTGRMLIMGKVASQTAAVDISGIKPGIYLLRIQSGNAIHTRQLIVE